MNVLRKAGILGCSGLLLALDACGAGSNPDGPCPSSPPANGAPCTPGMSCSWGGHPSTGCRTRAICEASAWKVTQPPPACAGPLLPPGCPASPPAVSPCSGDLACYYDDGTACGCGVCCNAPGCISCGAEPEGSHVWSCTPPPSDPNCPKIPPNDGVPCSAPPGTACPKTQCGLSIVCRDGIWRWEFNNECPGCAAPETRIATPGGERPIGSLMPGDLVYSVHRGAILAVPIARTGRASVAHHEVVRAWLASGRAIDISPGHPTPDGRSFADLRSGDWLGTERVESVRRVPYARPYTVDILPDSDTRTYFASGALVASTLR